MEREALFLVASGMKGVGKTYLTKSVIEQYVKGNPANNIPPRKVLILDVNNEFGNYKLLRPADIMKFTVHPTIEARRIGIMREDGSKMTLNEYERVAIKALDTFRNGLIVLEDIAKYVNDTINGDLVGSLCTQRHVDNDIITHFQSIGKPGNPKIKSNMSVLRYHKCLDTVERHKGKFLEYTEILKIAENLVNKKYASGDIYFFCYVMFDKNKISGGFTKSEFKDAINEYIEDNESETIGKLTKKKSRKTGKAMYTFSQAWDLKEKELLDTYYGNPK